ncbi:MAG TPA: hypothetical protein VLA09_10760, partial [Longimicrobiales bacterium]|nr:hypothetical protein [Longimicrobiales bacterium]
EDATRAARSVLTPLARRRLEPEQIDRVGRALERRVEELRSIASDVREDGSELGFDCEEMLRRVRGGIVALAAELELDPALARRTYRREVDPALADLLGCVQRRLEVVDQG